jgi:predicted DNA binding CopG/RHH family protein
MPAKAKIYTADELTDFHYTASTLAWMDEEDGSMDMIREWQKWAFPFKSDGLEPVEFVWDKNDRVTLSVPRFDLFRLKEVATRKGIPYQTYLKMIIREDVAREAVLHR